MKTIQERVKEDRKGFNLAIAQACPFTLLKKFADADFEIIYKWHRKSLTDIEAECAKEKEEAIKNVICDNCHHYASNKRTRKLT